MAAERLTYQRIQRNHEERQTLALERIAAALDALAKEYLSHFQPVATPPESPEEGTGEDDEQGA